MRYIEPDDSDIEGTRAFPAFGAAASSDTSSCDGRRPGDGAPEAGRAGNEWPDEKWPDEKWPDEKWPDEKRPDEKRPDEKRPDEKRPDEKRPDEKRPRATRLCRLQPDRVIITCGTIVAAVAVAVGFATAGGASPPAHRSPAPAVCVAPASGH